MYEHSLWKKKKESANKKLAERLLKLALRGWIGLIPQRQVLASNIEPYNLLLHLRLLTKWFWRWYLYVSQKMINPAKDSRLILAQRHHERQLLQSAFDGWDRVRFSTCLAREVDQHCLESPAMVHPPFW
ncbi:hypothetical protein R1sor_007543 [Riccia sorocarpa]|uniref:Uncharacterized protein n=1 Tax=Riccia sorocarpa TaxID=122646 RepID=A0ABD3HTP3_9MARC